MSGQLVTTAQRTDIATLREILENQRVRRLDAVVPASALKFATDGTLVIPDSAGQVLAEDGVTSLGGQYTPSATFNSTIAERTPIPGNYLRYLAENLPGLYAANLNGLLEADRRKFFLRLFRGDTDGTGIARALLSDRFRPIDGLDVLVAVMAGLHEAGLGVGDDLPPEKRIVFNRCDLTESRMFVQIDAPSIKAVAGELLKGYRNPRTGKSADEDDTVHAGIVVSTSEIGGGAARVVPRITYLVCSNGQTFTQDAFAAIHVGTKRQEGIVAYSDDTVAAELALITKRARDAVKTFLDVPYLEEKIAELSAEAGIEVSKPEATIAQVVEECGFPEEVRENVFAMFLKGGASTAFGVSAAVTAAAADVDDPELAYEMEDKAAAAMSIAARIA